MLIETQAQLPGIEPAQASAGSMTFVWGRPETVTTIRICGVPGVRVTRVGPGKTVSEPPASAGSYGTHRKSRACPPSVSAQAAKAAGALARYV